MLAHPWIIQHTCRPFSLPSSVSRQSVPPDETTSHPPPLSQFNVWSPCRFYHFNDNARLSFSFASGLWCFDGKISSRSSNPSFFFCFLIFIVFGSFRFFINVLCIFPFQFLFSWDSSGMFYWIEFAKNYLFSKSPSFFFYNPQWNVCFFFF